MSSKPYQFKVVIPEGYSSVEREAIAAEIVSFVRQRTLAGEDFNHKNFPKYSKNYFKKGKPDLNLSGEMLAELDAVKIKEKEIVIGYGDDSENAGKAEGNQIGSYGRDPNPKKARKFLGLNPSDLKDILKKYPIDDPEKSAERAADILEADKEVKEFAGTLKKSGEGKEMDPKKLAKNFKLTIG